jgi:hypothetical protein
MASCTKKPESFMQVCLISIAIVFAAELDATSKKVTDKPCRSCDALIFRRNIALQAGSGIDTELATLVNRTSQTAVILARVQIVRIVLRVINVFLRAISLKIR